eukprot:TRINITY_DN90253_c0_g1_i1.p1 TRINITY_DN90253_c0_g1~~TRINITY_DN90253_c0_g1_i1.p1  ORF type:complete len:298 (+),score=54.25 TRINITY_DN90253_c0_g1_i1:116-1009(+)
MAPKSRNLESARKDGSANKSSTSADSGDASQAAKCQRLHLAGEAFDCPICQEAMLTRIYICPAGHSVCGDCFGRLVRCPSCQKSYAVPPARNLFLESMIQECQLPCRFQCGLKAKPPELVVHEKRCHKKPAQCLVCTHSCLPHEMLAHLRAAHVDRRPGSKFMDYGSVDYLEVSIHADSCLHLKYSLIVSMQNIDACVHSLRAEQGKFMADIVHFGETAQSVQYEFTIGDTQAGAGLSLTGRARSLLEDKDDQPFSVLEIPLTMARRFAKNTVDELGLCWGRLKIFPKVASEEVVTV